MILDIDIGNSRVKWLLRESAGVAERGVCASIESLITLLRRRDLFPRRTRVCCVGETGGLDQLDAWLRLNQLPAVEKAVSTRSVAKVTNGYQQPERLGVDRWLAICAAWHRFERPVAVVDAGSAMTIDLVDGRGNHCGGYIVPGFAMQQRSLIANTRLVRFDTDLSGVELGPGRSTTGAVNNGIALMLKSMVESAVQNFRLLSGEAPALVLTGGDAGALSGLLQVPHSLEPDLVLEGINLVMP
jgi:type III pantothenate kinase